MTDPLAREEVTVDRLVGDWRIHQLRRGHRFSTDDLLTAWTAVRALPGARRLLDLGSGIGSVGLSVLWHLPPDARMVAVEAQAISHALCRRTVALNGLADRVELRLADLRDPEAIPEAERGTWELVTGSPPYIPVGKGLISPHPQRAHARIELRGDVFDYCRAAARALAPGGRFCFCHAAGDPRPERAVEAAGLRLLWRQDVVFRRGRPPTIALFACAWEGERQDRPPVVVREADGAWTEAYRRVRAELAAPT